MPSIFSTLAVITQEEHDAECLNPSYSIRPAAPEYLCPRSDTLESSLDNSEDVQPCPDPNTPATSSTWLSRISKRKHAEDKVRAANALKLAEELDRQIMFKVGCYVTSRHKLIAPLSKSPVKKRRTRTPVHGEIMARSLYQPRFWLVKFRNEKVFYCIDTALNYVSTSAPTIQLGRNAKNELCTKKIDRTFTNQEYIMDLILSSKVCPIPGHSKITFNAILCLFKETHPWLTVPKLKHHSYKMHNKLKNIPSETWISSS